MPIYSVSTNKAGVNTANTIMWQLRAASGCRIRILELALSVGTAPTTGPAWRLNRSTALGTSTATVTPQLEDPADIAAPLGLLDTTWSANPTLAATDLRQYATPNSIGAGIVWTWYNEPLVLPASTGVCLVNGNATGATLGNFRLYVVYKE